MPAHDQDEQPANGSGVSVMALRSRFGPTTQQKRGTVQREVAPKGPSRVSSSPFAARDKQESSNPFKPSQQRNPPWSQRSSPWMKRNQEKADSAAASEPAPARNSTITSLPRTSLRKGKWGTSLPQPYSVPESVDAEDESDDYEEETVTDEVTLDSDFDDEEYEEIVLESSESEYEEVEISDNELLLLVNGGGGEEEYEEVLVEEDDETNLVSAGLSTFRRQANGTKTNALGASELATIAEGEGSDSPLSPAGKTEVGRHFTRDSSASPAREPEQLAPNKRAPPWGSTASSVKSRTSLWGKTNTNSEESVSPTANGLPLRERKHEEMEKSNSGPFAHLNAQKSTSKSSFDLNPRSDSQRETPSFAKKGKFSSWKDRQRQAQSASRPGSASSQDEPEPARGRPSKWSRPKSLAESDSIEEKVASSLKNGFSATMNQKGTGASYASEEESSSHTPEPDQSSRDTVDSPNTALHLQSNADSESNKSQSPRTRKESVSIWKPVKSRRSSFDGGMNGSSFLASGRQREEERSPVTGRTPFGANGRQPSDRELIRTPSFAVREQDESSLSSGSSVTPFRLRPRTGSRPFEVNSQEEPSVQPSTRPFGGNKRLTASNPFEVSQSDEASPATTSNRPFGGALKKEVSIPRFGSNPFGVSKQLSWRNSANPFEPGMQKGSSVRPFGPKKEDERGSGSSTRTFGVGKGVGGRTASKSPFEARNSSDTGVRPIGVKGGGDLSPGTDSASDLQTSGTDLSLTHASEETASSAEGENLEAAHSKAQSLPLKGRLTSRGPDGEFATKQNDEDPGSGGASSKSPFQSLSIPGGQNSQSARATNKVASNKSYFQRMPDADDSRGTGSSVAKARRPARALLRQDSTPYARTKSGELSDLVSTGKMNVKSRTAAWGPEQNKKQSNDDATNSVSTHDSASVADESSEAGVSLVNGRRSKYSDASPFGEKKSSDLSHRVSGGKVDVKSRMAAWGKPGGSSSKPETSIETNNTPSVGVGAGNRWRRKTNEPNPATAASHTETDGDRARVPSVVSSHGNPETVQSRNTDTLPSKDSKTSSDQNSTDTGPSRNAPVSGGNVRSRMAAWGKKNEENSTSNSGSVSPIANGVSTGSRAQTGSWRSNQSRWKTKAGKGTDTDVDENDDATTDSDLGKSSSHSSVSRNPPSRTPSGVLKNNFSSYANRKVNPYSISRDVSSRSVASSTSVGTATSYITAKKDDALLDRPKQETGVQALLRKRREEANGINHSETGTARGKMHTFSNRLKDQASTSQVEAAEKPKVKWQSYRNKNADSGAASTDRERKQTLESNEIDSVREAAEDEKDEGKGREAPDRRGVRPRRSKKNVLVFRADDKPVDDTPSDDNREDGMTRRTMIRTDEASGSSPRRGTRRTIAEDLEDSKSAPRRPTRRGTMEHDVNNDTVDGAPSSPRRPFRRGSLDHTTHSDSADVIPSSPRRPFRRGTLENTKSDDSVDPAPSSPQRPLRRGTLDHTTSKDSVDASPSSPRRPFRRRTLDHPTNSDSVHADPPSPRRHGRRGTLDNSTSGDSVDAAPSSPSKPAKHASNEPPASPRRHMRRPTGEGHAGTEDEPLESKLGQRVDKDEKPDIVRPFSKRMDGRSRRTDMLSLKARIRADLKSMSPQPEEPNVTTAASESHGGNFPFSKKESGGNTLSAEELDVRRNRVYEWYARCGLPSREVLKEKAAALPQSKGITVDDVDLLMWNPAGTWVNLAEMNKPRRHTQKEKRAVKPRPTEPEKNESYTNEKQTSDEGKGRPNIVSRKQSDESVIARRNRVYEWYARCGMPSKEALMERAADLPESAGIAVEDVELLLWNPACTWVNVSEMNKMMAEEAASSGRRPEKKVDNHSETTSRVSTSSGSKSRHHPKRSISADPTTGFARQASAERRRPPGDERRPEREMEKPIRPLSPARRSRHNRSVEPPVEVEGVVADEEHENIARQQRRHEREKSANTETVSDVPPSSKAQNTADKLKQDDPDGVRRKRVYEWYARCGMPPKVVLLEKVSSLPWSSGITREDVELLTWNAAGTWVNIAEMNSILYRGVKGARPKKEESESYDDSESTALT